MKLTVKLVNVPTEHIAIETLRAIHVRRVDLEMNDPEVP